MHLVEAFILSGFKHAFKLVLISVNKHTVVRVSSQCITVYKTTCDFNNLLLNAESNMN